MNLYRTCTKCHAARALISQDWCLPCVLAWNEKQAKRKRVKRPDTQQRWGVSVKPETYERLKAEAERRGVSVSVLIEEALP